MSSSLSRLLSRAFGFQSSISFTNPLLIPAVTSSRRAYTNSGSDPIIIEQLTEGEKYLYEKLSKNLNPTRLRVEDISGGCGSMYSIEISSERFKGLPMINQHRMVNELLHEEIKNMHGIQLKTSAS
ncbi:17060_t:CDS:2 [Acaulospora colombiana]|uniref:17060_t:CDS:1 n=1 Tax=Acaulospora colombiana TaxID=27376 RepID=A0ACA9ME75_9GLOM|nr:17060_t:CDS:2 [Acaulospora colombiana]